MMHQPLPIPLANVPALLPPKSPLHSSPPLPFPSQEVGGGGGGELAFNRGKLRTEMGVLCCLRVVDVPALQISQDQITRK